VVGEYATRAREGQRRVFQRAAGAVVASDRGVVDRRDGDRRRGGAALGLAVAGLVGEAVGAAEAGGRRVGGAAIAAERQRAVGHTADERRRELVVVGIGVVAEDARSSHGQRAFLGDLVVVI